MKFEEVMEKMKELEEISFKVYNEYPFIEIYSDNTGKVYLSAQEDIYSEFDNLQECYDHIIEYIYETRLKVIE